VVIGKGTEGHDRWGWVFPPTDLFPARILVVENPVLNEDARLCSRTAAIRSAPSFAESALDEATNIVARLTSSGIVGCCEGGEDGLKNGENFGGDFGGDFVGVHRITLSR
jgi:hypothetical protein